MCSTDWWGIAKFAVGVFLALVVQWIWFVGIDWWRNR